MASYRGPDGTLYPSKAFYDQQIAQQAAGKPSTFGVGAKKVTPQPEVPRVDKPLDPLPALPVKKSIPQVQPQVQIPYAPGKQPVQQPIQPQQAPVQAGQPVKIGGTLYPSQQWYDQNVLKQQPIQQVEKPEVVQPQAEGQADTGQPEVVEAPKVDPHLQTTTTPEQQGLISQYGYTPDQISDPNFLKSEVERLTTSLDGLEDEAGKEKGIQQIIDLYASQGLDFPQSAISALLGGESKTEDELRTEIEDRLGIKGVADRAFKNAPKTWEEIYSAAYKDLGLASTRTKIEQVIDKIEAVERAANLDIADIRDNPWLSKKSTNYRVNERKQRALEELSVLQNKQNLLSTLYDRGREDAENLASRALNTYAAEQKLDQQQLAFLMDRVETELGSEVAQQETDLKKESFRYFPQFAEALSTQAELEGGTQQETIDNYVRAVESGQMKIESVPSELRSDVMNKVDLSLIPEKADTPKDVKITDQTRVTTADTFINSKRGSDGLISASDYVETRKQFIAQGGTSADFKAAFPPEWVMGQWELANLPSSIYKQTTITASENKRLLNIWLSTPEAQALSNDEIKQEIRGAGETPSDFGYY